jgi:hypothetical protein
MNPGATYMGPAKALAPAEKCTTVFSFSFELQTPKRGVITINENTKHDFTRTKARRQLELRVSAPRAVRNRVRWEMSYGLELFFTEVSTAHLKVIARALTPRFYALPFDA